MEKKIEENTNSDDIQEIISAVPSWILRWGIIVILSILLGLILLSALVRYPDVVKINLKINSLNAPQAILTKKTGKLIKLLVNDGQLVRKGQILAYFESTAMPEDILTLRRKLNLLKSNVLAHRSEILNIPEGLVLGEMQANFQVFFNQYLEYKSTIENGYYLKRMKILEKDLQNITALNVEIHSQKKIRIQEYKNQEEEYLSYQKLYKNKVISRSEFAQQENKYLAQKYPLQESNTAILNNTIDRNSKEKELLDLQHTITEEQAKFIQALNQCITESDYWIMQYVLIAPFTGNLTFAGIVQQNQNIQANQEVFIINPGNTNFFGEVQIPQYNMGRIKEGSNVLIKMRSYPFEQFGLIRGKLAYISENAYKDSLFLAKINFEHFENKDHNRPITLKNGMLADAEIITEDSSLLQRFFKNLTKMFNTY